MKNKTSLSQLPLHTWMQSQRSRAPASLTTGVAFLSVLLAMGRASAAEYYVSPTGSDSNPGTQASPFATLQKANNSVAAGDTIWMRAGTYSITSQLTLSKSGTSDTNRTKIWAYAGEVPILDVSNYGAASSGSDVPAVLVTGNWMHLKGLEIGPAKVGSNGSHSYSLLRTKNASNNTFELLNIHNGFGPGLFIDTGTGGNLILNCDSHDNYDVNGSQGDGQNGDGFGVHYQTTGPSTLVRGCRAWHDSDDGYDFISQEVPVTIENSFATGCGYGSSGNGNGFKAGSSKTGIRHIVQNNVAWKNKASGFYANHSTGGNNWYNNTAYSNGTQFNLLASSFDSTGNVTGTITLTGAKAHVMRNNIGFPNDNTNMGGVDTANNTWDLNITPATSDFASISDTGCTGPRDADGSIPAACTFMHLTAGSPMIDKGKDVGLPYVGAAPDLGAYEFGAVTAGAGGTSGGSGGSTGSTGSGGSIRNDAGAGSGGTTRSDGSVGNGGSTSNGGSIASNGGSTGVGGIIIIIGNGGNTSNGGALTAGTTGTTGGAAGTGGKVIAATGGATAAGGIVSAGGASQGTGGSMVAETGGSSNPLAGTGGATGVGTGGSSASAPASSGGCGCTVGSRAPRGEMAAFLMVAALSLLARRRRDRT
jgi:MYXO-CTERM domain-containing protein